MFNPMLDSYVLISTIFQPLTEYVESLGKGFWQSLFASGLGAFAAAWGVTWLGREHRIQKNLADLNSVTVTLSVLFNELVSLKINKILPARREFDLNKENMLFNDRKAKGEPFKPVSSIASIDGFMFSSHDLSKDIDKLAVFANVDFAPLTLLKRTEIALNDLYRTLEVRKNILEEMRFSDLDSPTKMRYFYGLAPLGEEYNFKFKDSLEGVETLVDSCLWYMYYMQQRYNTMTRKAIPKGVFKKRTPLKFGISPSYINHLPPRDYLHGFDQLL